MGEHNPYIHTDEYWNEYWRTSIEATPIEGVKREMAHANKLVLNDIIREEMGGDLSKRFTAEIQERALARAKSMGIETTANALTVRIVGMRKAENSHGTQHPKTVRREDEKPLKKLKQSAPAAKKFNGSAKDRVRNAIAELEQSIIALAEENDALSAFKERVLEAAQG